MSDGRPDFEAALKTVPAPEVGGDFYDRMVDELMRRGFSFEAATAIAGWSDDLRCECEGGGGHRSEGETLRRIGLALDSTALYETPVGRAFRRVLLGAQGRSLADDASRVDCTKQTLAYHVDRIEKAIAHLTTRSM